MYQDDGGQGRDIAVYQDGGGQGRDIAVYQDDVDRIEKLLRKRI